MARGFKNTPRGYTAYFEKPELLLIRDLAEDIVALLQPETGQDADPLDARYHRQPAGGHRPRRIPSVAGRQQ